ncbi:hypothetical protein MJO29_001941 [Puccinia striiformis f. sp. tritici]|nr:hypothetical protein MJO29_001941 [Puccinia striiformis f. sp. tritici]
MSQLGPQNQAQAQSNNYLQPLKMESIPGTISMSLPIPLAARLQRSSQK